MYAEEHAQDPPLHLWLDRRCRAAGFSPNIVQEIYHAHDYAALVSHGVGVGLGFGFSKASFGKQLFQNLVLRAFSSPQLAIDVALIFGDKFNFRPLSGYVTAIQKSRDRRPPEDTRLPLSA